MSEDSREVELELPTKLRRVSVEMTQPVEPKQVSCLHRASCRPEQGYPVTPGRCRGRDHSSASGRCWWHMGRHPQRRQLPRGAGLAATVLARSGFVPIDGKSSDRRVPVG